MKSLQPDYNKNAFLFNRNVHLPSTYLQPKCQMISVEYRIQS